MIFASKETRFLEARDLLDHSKTKVVITGGAAFRYLLESTNLFPSGS